jgi:hypothetical protein
MMLKGTRKTEIELKERENRVHEQGSEETCKCETCFPSLEITENTYVQPVELLRKHSHPIPRKLEIL